MDIKTEAQLFAANLAIKKAANAIVGAAQADKLVNHVELAPQITVEKPMMAQSHGYRSAGVFLTQLDNMLDLSS